jgi:hypothetical protein
MIAVGFITYIGEKMTNISKMFLSTFFIIFAQGCATVGAISDGVQKGVAGTVDVVLGTTSNIVTTVVDEGSRIGQAGAELVVGIGQTAGDLVAGSVQAVAKVVDESTDAVQDKEEEPKEEAKK